MVICSIFSLPVSQVLSLPLGIICTCTTVVNSEYCTLAKEFNWDFSFLPKLSKNDHIYLPRYSSCEIRRASPDFSSSQNHPCLTSERVNIFRPRFINIVTTRPGAGWLTNFISWAPTVLCPQTAGVVLLRTTGRRPVTGHARTTTAAH